MKFGTVKMFLKEKSKKAKIIKELWSNLLVVVVTTGWPQVDKKKNKHNKNDKHTEEIFRTRKQVVAVVWKNKSGWVRKHGKNNKCSKNYRSGSATSIKRAVYLKYSKI